jgi:uncharacterized protein YndB with AHSA1/START domain
MNDDEQAESEVLVPAPTEETWEAITDPDRLSEWLGDRVELDLTPGGGLEVDLGEERRSGFVEEVEPERRLVFWWARDDEESSRVEIELEPDGEGTRVRVVESRPLRVLDLPAVEIDGRLEGGGSSPQMSAGPLALVT